MKLRRLKPKLFLKAAEALQKAMNDCERTGRYDGPEYCCNLFHYKSPELRLFVEYFKPKNKKEGNAWFGDACRFGEYGGDYYPGVHTYRPIKKNQNARIQALLFCYEIAKRVR